MGCLCAGVEAHFIPRALVSEERRFPRPEQPRLCCESVLVAVVDLGCFGSSGIVAYFSVSCRQLREMTDTAFYLSLFRGNNF